MPKVAFITGASRGIGLACAHRLARAGWDVVIAAKTVDPHPKLPGTIFTAAQALREHGREVLPLRCDVRNLEEVDTAAKATLDKFGRVDAIINNAGALWWKRMDEVPMKRYDLVNEVNSRGAYAVTFAVPRAPQTPAFRPHHQHVAAAEHEDDPWPHRLCHLEARHDDAGDRNRP
ncbi:MAG: SDR family NAD(P)-dependent oxidoreductase [Bryobacterales bacterium]